MTPSIEPFRHGLVPKTKDTKTGRDILHRSTDRASLVQQAKDHARQFEDGLKSATRGIAGAKFDSVRAAKDPKRLDEKVKDEKQPIHTIPDILAGRISIDSPEAHARTADSIRKHFNVVRDVDEFDKGDPDTGYRVHKMQVKVTPELSAEAHLVPKEVLAANEKQHDVYEDARDAELDGKDGLAAKKTKQAKAINDAAMDAFNARNEVGKSNKEGGRGESPEQVGAAVGTAAPALTSNDAPKQEVKAGSNIRLKDGTHAKVAYAPPPKAPIPMYRLRTTNDGKTLHVRARDIDGVTVLPGDWIGVDIDKTLAHFTQFKGATNIGKPIPEMVAKVKQWLKEGEDVRIFTARIAHDPTGVARKAIEQWCEKNIGMKLPITNVKDDKMRLLFDDRARQVEPNTGKVVGDDSTQATGSVREPAAVTPPAGTQGQGKEPATSPAIRPGTGAGQSVGSWQAGLVARA